MDAIEAHRKYERRKKLKRTIIAAIILLPLTAFLVLFNYDAGDVNCYHYVEDFHYEASLSTLSEHISYSQLSWKLKKQLDASDWELNSDEDILALARKLENNSAPKKNGKCWHSYSDFRHPELWTQFELDGKRYNVEFDLTFAPRALFFMKPKVVSWTSYIKEYDINKT